MAVVYSMIGLRCEFMKSARVNYALQMWQLQLRALLFDLNKYCGAKLREDVCRCYLSFVVLFILLTLRNVCRCLGLCWLRVRWRSLVATSQLRRHG